MTDQATLKGGHVTWLAERTRQVERASNPKTCLPIVILQNPGDDLVVLRLADFEDWFGEVREFKG